MIRRNPASTKNWLMFFSVFLSLSFCLISQGWSENGRAASNEQSVVFAVNCGGPAYTDKSGVVYQADSYFSGGQTYQTPAAILGTEDGALYQTERWGKFSYNLPLTNGDYKVTLKFAEIYEYAKWTGMRVFNVKVKGSKFISDLDLVVRAGQYKAYDVIIPVTIKDGVLNIEFYNERETAKVNGILVTKEGAAIPGKGILKGKVTDSLTKLPIFQATVSVTDSSNTPKLAPTDQNGMYEIREIVPGEISGEMKKYGHEPYSFQKNISSGETLEVSGDLKPILPVIKNIQTMEIAADSAKIYWETDQEADSLVEYGDTPSYGGLKPDSTLTKIHQVPLGNLKPGTQYHYKVTSKNMYGFPSSSGDYVFTTQALSSPINVKITYPADGSSISKSTTRVEGTIVNSSGVETGVVVNGVLANVWEDKFFANTLPLQEGKNTITAVARDVNGETRKDAVEVNRISSYNYLRIMANIESGIPPFQTILNLDANLDLTNALLTYVGPGDVEIIPSTSKEYRIKIQTEGVYIITAKVSDSSGVLYEDSVAVTVFAKGEIDNLLKGKWEDMRTKLAAGDIESSLRHFDESTQQDYKEVFKGLVAVLSNIVQEMADIQLVKFSKDTAIYDIRTVRDGEEYSFQLLFTKDSDGLWTINSF